MEHCIFDAALTYKSTLVYHIAWLTMWCNQNGQNWVYQCRNCDPTTTSPCSASGPSHLTNLRGRTSGPLPLLMPPVPETHASSRRNVNRVWGEPQYQGVEGPPLQFHWAPHDITAVHTSPARKARVSHFCVIYKDTRHTLCANSPMTDKEAKVGGDYIRGPARIKQIA